jgi:N-sulfoglucosamine sulfohydrolase
MIRWLLSLIACTVASVSLAGPRNAILIVADDLGLTLGCYGDPVAKTPHIDALAKSGTRFTNGFASVASCSPSRSTMLTGMPTHQNGMYGLAHADHNFHSYPKIRSLPGYLNEVGYRTGVIAKLHVQPKEVYPFTETIAGGGGRNPVAIANAAKTFIQSCGEKPFYLHVGFTDPHRAAGPRNFANAGKLPASIKAVKYDPAKVPVPYHLPDSADIRMELAEYYESVSRLDQGVGLLVDLLKETGKWEDTLILFISDNGIPFPGAKTTLYDSGVHLPLIIRKPGQKGGLVNEAMASWTDLMPTILDWCGVAKPNALPGRSVLPVLERENPEGWDTVYGSHQFHEVTMYYPMRMVRTKTHKYILNLAHKLEYPHASDLWGSDAWQGILKRKDTMMGQKSVSSFLNRPNEELFDLTKDPNELVNLSGDPAQEKVLSALRKKLADWRKATSDPWLIKEKHE